MPGGEFPMAEAMPAQSPTNTEQNHANAGQGHANAGQGHVPTQCDLVPRLVRGHPGKAAHRVRAMGISEKLWAAATPTLAPEQVTQKAERGTDGADRRRKCRAVPYTAACLQLFLTLYKPQLHQVQLYSALERKWSRF